MKMMEMMNGNYEGSNKDYYDEGCYVDDDDNIKHLGALTN